MDGRSRVERNVGAGKSMQKCDKQRFMKGNVSRFGRGYEATAKENDTEGNEQGLEYSIGQARYHAPPVKSSDG